MTSTTAIVLNFISLIETIFIGVMSIFMFSVLLRSIIRNRDVVLILVANSYVALLAFALIAIAAFRFFRVVYSSSIWLQYSLTYAVIIPILWLISFLFLLPVHAWHDIQLMSTESICVLAIHSARGFIWSTIFIYGLPMNIINTIYFQLARFMRRSPLPTSARTKRDVIVIHRIVLVVIILILMGAPSVVLELMLPFTDVGKPLFYRISNMTIVTAMLALSFMLVYVTPQVTEILMRIGKQHQVIPTYSQPRFGLPSTTIKR
ncbi:unnamed protein product [Rotaria sp. Silwood1]|nr:unnamed protein product [Rotaria sp. Silwood1]CAF1212798.1 unnamed protein product [Rotaria sp. Silwood1]CAF3480320.1 unnamed protein product [Rotaria sp. Silwood1]CAF3495567.1 unnamed protein product [Rotaria sp. Silwood1]CAF4630610.1 unnamed protein product [Rotaria sp. Silwood1]